MLEFAIGVDIGGTYTKVGLVHRKKGVVHCSVIPTNASEGLDKAILAISRAIVCVMEKAKKKERNNIAGIGIGVPGMVSLDRRFVSNPPNLGWGQRVPLSAKMESRFSKPCWLDNDANMYARGSMEFGSGKRKGLFCYVNIRYRRRRGYSH